MVRNLWYIFAVVFWLREINYLWSWMAVVDKIVWCWYTDSIWFKICFEYQWLLQLPDKCKKMGILWWCFIQQTNAKLKTFFQLIIKNIKQTSKLIALINLIYTIVLTIRSLFYFLNVSRFNVTGSRKCFVSDAELTFKMVRKQSFPIEKKTQYKPYTTVCPQTGAFFSLKGFFIEGTLYFSRKNKLEVTTFLIVEQNLN